MKGGCLCEAVRFELEPPVRDVVVCHCSLCRRSGTLAGAYVGVVRVGLKIIGDPRWYVDVNGRRRGFCATCGATLFWDAGGETISVSAGALDGDSGLHTLKHIFVRDAAVWERVPDDAPHRDA